MPSKRKKSVLKKVKEVKHEQKIKIKLDKEDDKRDKALKVSPKDKKRYDRARLQGTQKSVATEYGSLPVNVVKRKKSTGRRKK